MPQRDRITEIVSPKAQKQVEILDQKLREILGTYNDLAKAAQNITTPKGGNKVLEERIKLDKKSIELSTKLARQKKAEADAEAAAERAKKAALLTEKAKNNEVKRSTGANSTNIAQLKSLNSAYQQQSRLLISLRQRQKDLNTQKIQGIKLTKSEQSELRRLTNRVRSLDTQLKKVDAAAGQFQRNVGNYPKVVGAATRSLRAFAGAFGFTSGIFLLVGALRETFRVFKEFDQSQADLAAILGKSRSEIVKLTKQAKELGSTTAFTATQVAKLQIELSKLGFTEDQILASAEAVENLAIATGVDAARAAKLAGAAIRGFALDAEEANRVASVLAVSTTKSASSFETLEVALPKVSAIAKAFNFTVEDTVALLSGLQNAGFEASIAGTSLRQIFLQLADSNGKLAKRLGGNVRNFDELVEAFKQVEEEGIDLAEAFELTNARSVAAFKVFLQGADDLKVLRDSITDVDAELKKLADTKLDSLQGDITLLTSAWEGFVLAVEDGEGAISRFLRSTVQAFTSVFEFLKELNLTPEELQESFNKGLEQQAYLDSLANLEVESLKTGKTIEEVARGSFFTFQTEVDKARAAVTLAEERIKKANDAIEEGGSRGAAYADEIEKYNEELAKASKTLAIKQGRLRAVNESLRSNKVATDQANESSKSQNEFLEGTIAFYQDFIKKQTELQSKTAQSSEEYKRFQRNIDVAKAKIEALQGVYDDLDLSLEGEGFEDLLGLDFIEPEDENLQFEVKAFLDSKGVESILKKLADDTGRTTEEIEKLWEDVNVKNFQNALIFAEKYIELNEDIRDRQAEIYNGIGDVVGESLNSVLQLQINRLDEQADANDEYYDRLLERENLTDEERERIEKQRDERDKQIRLKRQKIEKQQFLLSQLSEAAFVTIDLFKTIAAIKAQAAILAANPITAALAPVALSQIPLVTASSGLAIAGILAQSIPAFFKGKSPDDNYEGWATVNELPGQREYKIDQYGGVTAYKAGMQLDYVKSSDIIVPSMSTFNRELKNPESDVFKRLSHRVETDTIERVHFIQTDQPPIDTKGIEKVMERVMMKYANRPIKTTVNVEPTDNYTQY